MAQETTYAGTIGEWQRLLARLKLNSEALAHLEASRAKLETLLARTIELGNRQAAAKAEKQEISKELRGLLPEGRRLATLLRVGVREHFGPQSEKLAEFNLQPFRGRPRKVKPTPDGPGEPGGDTPPPPVHPEAADTPLN
jgi:hypothetical protein